MHSQPYAGGRLPKIVVFPKAHDKPPILSQPRGSLSITFLISLNLGIPEGVVCFRSSVMFRASMPETSIHKDSHLASREGNINAATPNTGHWPMHTIAKASRME